MGFIERLLNKGREIAEKLNSNYGLPYILSPVNSDFNDYYKGFINSGDTREQALKKVAEYLLNPDNIIEANHEEDSETPGQRIERLKNLYPFTTPPLEALPTLNNGIKIGDIIQNLADSIGCSTNSMIGSALLVPLSIAGQFVLCKKHDSHTLKNRFNIVDISLPSTGKTAAQEQLAFNPLDDYYMDEIENYKFLLAEYEKAEKLAEAKQKRGDTLTLEEENFLKKEKPLNPGKPSVTGGTIQGYARPGTAPVNKTKLLFMDEIQELAKQVLNPKADIDAGGLVKLMDGSRYRPNHATKDEGGSNIQIHLLGNTQPDNFYKYMKPLLKNNDGFAVRILYTYDGTGKPFEPKTEEDFYKTWLPEYKTTWLSLVQRGCDFNKNICNIYKEKLKNKECQKINPPVLYIGLNEDAEAEYLRVYNEIGVNIQQGEGDLLSTSFAKFQDYTLTIAVSLYLLEMFGNNNKLATEITGQDTAVYMEARHIINAEKIIKFYIGQLVEIVSVYLMDFKGSHSVTDKRFFYLAETLEALRPDIEDGMLAKGYIAEKYTEKTSQKITPEKISSLLKQAGLTSTKSRKRINGKNSSCLIWDTKTDNFIKRLKPTGTTSKLEQTPINKGLELNRVENCNRNNTCKYEDEKKKVYGLKPTGTNQNVTETPVNKSVVPVNQLYGLNSDQQTKPVEQEQVSFNFETSITEEF